MSARRLAVLLTLLSLPSFPAPGVAQGRVIAVPCVGSLPRRPMDERIPIPIGGCQSSIERTSSRVTAELTDQVIRYEVEERFVNRGALVGEAEYLFPLPQGAAFQDLKLSINGELSAGETLPATEARQIYEEIVRRQRDPALVEWMGSGLLRARIFPINPGEEKRVVVRFQRVAPREGDAVRVDWGGLREPQGARQTAASSAATFTLTYPDAAIYGRAYSPTHAIDVTDRGGGHTVTVRGDARDVTVLIPVRRGADPAIGALAYAPGGEDGYALITVSPPASSDRATTVTPRDVTLVLDISGSMEGQKMTQARAAARQVLATLSPRDRFRLVDFATDVHTFPQTSSSRREWYAEATPQNLRAAREYIDALDASGSTNIEGALVEAMRPPADSERLPLVLFITDGEPTVGSRDPGALVNLVRPMRGDPGRAPRRVFTFGVGADVNASLLEQIALEAAGTSQFVRPEESVERAVSLVASRLVDPVLTNIEVRAEGGIRLAKVLPPRGADLFAGQDLVVLARYSGDGPGRIVVEGMRRGAPVRWTQDVSFPAQDRSNLFVARLWATQRVGYLAAEKRRNGGSSEVDREIRDLGERYGIPTEYTSYLVKEPGVIVPQPRRIGGGGAGGGGGGGGGAAGAGGGRGGLGTGTPVPALAATTSSATRMDTFEAARAAADQRTTTSLASADSAARRKAGDAGGDRVRIVNGRTFELRDSAWTDAQFRPELRTIAVKAYSKAWFDLVARLPELKSAFALGDRVIVAGRKVAVSVSPAGVDTLGARDLDQLLADW